MVVENCLDKLQDLGHFYRHGSFAIKLSAIPLVYNFGLPDYEEQRLLEYSLPRSSPCTIIGRYSVGRDHLQEFRKNPET